MIFLLEFRDLNITYKTDTKDVYALKNLNLTMKSRETWGIVGESGSGKSTFMLGALGLLPKGTIVSGSEYLDDTEILGMNIDFLNKLRWEKMAVVFQKAMNNFSPVHKIGKQFRDIYKLKRKDDPEMDKNIESSIKRVDLDLNVLKLYPHQLSGGMMQRVNIALSIMFDPDVLWLDEATSALDIVTERLILEEILKIDNEKMIKILITHNINIVRYACSHMTVLYGGEVLEYGKVKDILKQPRHPYTMGLLNSVTDIDDLDKNIEAIGGSLPDLTVLHKGCIFYDRCKFRLERCKIKPREIKKDREMVKCYLYEDNYGKNN